MDEISERLLDLINRFRLSEPELIRSNSAYSETEARTEYIDPLFELLGWDMNNTQGVRNSIKDVVREESQATETSTKFPDYTFRIFGHRKFFVEAKKPSVDIKTHIKSALQTRSYGWTASLPVSILTNFKTLRVYDTRIPPSENDTVDTALLMSIDYEDFNDHLEELITIFGRDNVAQNSIDTTFSDEYDNDLQINTAFIQIINEWRLDIANDLNSRYDDLDTNLLNDIAQKVINRIVFIRMCEDRGIEIRERLLSVAEHKDFIEIRALFQELDERYNTGLFEVENDRLQDSFVIDSDLFLSIVEGIYFPQAPYNFSVLDADFLGQIYEIFLSKQLFRNEANEFVLLDKPSHDGREIVTTPQLLVNEVVRRTFSAKMNTLKENDTFNFNQIKELKVLDIAVGSSRFLMRSFDELVDAAIEALILEGNTEDLYQISENEYRLSFRAKKDLISNCLFGIDIDYNAVEVARFSLIIKLLENENSGTIPSGTKILPSLDENIVWGNSLVESDFGDTTNEDPTTLDLSDTDLPEDFDIAIGNPPYVKTEEMKQKTPLEFKYYKRKYTTPHKQFDKYFVFIEKALNILSEDGCLGMVIPNKWITIESGKKLRNLLSLQPNISEIVNFGSNLVFEERSTYISLLMIDKKIHNNFFYRYISEYEDFQSDPTKLGIETTLSLISDDSPWVIPSNNTEKTILEALVENSMKLGDMCTVFNGLQTSAEDVFAISDYTTVGNEIHFTKNDIDYKVEASITRPYLMNSKKVISYSELKKDGLAIFPYTFNAEGVPSVIPPADLARNFPLTWAYLSGFRDRLLRRKVNPTPPANIFYAYGRHQALGTAFRSNKILYSVNQRGDKYAIDYTGTGFASGGTAGEVGIINPIEGYEIEYILAFLNQPIAEFFLRKRGSPFRGGYYSRGSAVVSDLPVPLLNLEDEEQKAVYDKIVLNSKKLISIQNQLPNASGRQIERLNSQKLRATNKLKELFASCLGLTDDFYNSIVLPD